MDQTQARVLLLDPNFVTRIALTSRLEASGMMVRAEKTTSTAARAATAANWDLILTGASLNIRDLEAFLETLALAEVKAVFCVVTDADDEPRREVSCRYKACVVNHPVRPQTLSELLAKPPTNGSAVFRTA